MNYITIDGVRYAPVTEANPSMDAIARGLAYGYWGESADKPLAELLDGLSVRVCDDGDGAPITEVLADIANAIALAQPAKPVAQEWRTEAVRWLRRKADAQQKVNDEHPAHVKCYPSWEAKVRDLNWLADDLEREQSEPPYGLEPWQAAQPEPVEQDDPLQGAVDWLLLADGEYFAVATVKRTLRIGYNRASRLAEIAKHRAAATKERT